MGYNYNTPLINESAHIDVFNATINGLPIRMQDIIDFQVDYGDIRRGKMSFVDTYNIAEFAPITSSLLSISYSDINKTLNSYEYMITSVDVMRLKENHINVIIEFESLVAYMLRTSYVSKAYSDKSMMYIIEDLFKGIGIEADFFDGLDDYKYEHFVTPANISVLDFVREQMKIDGITMFTSISGTVVANREYTDFANIADPKLKKLTLNRDKKEPHWYIMEYSGQVSNLSEMTDVTDSNLHYNDNSKLKYNPFKIKVDDLYKTQKINGFMGMGTPTLPDLIGNESPREISKIYQSSILGVDRDYRDIMKKNQTLSISLQGLNVDRTFSKIQIHLPRAGSVGTQEGDEVFSGTFVVTKITDKIISGNFIQFLELQSSDYLAGSSKLWS